MPEDVIREIEVLVSGAGAANDMNTVLRRIGAHFEAISGTLHVHRGDGMLSLAASFGVPDPLMPIVALIPIGKGIAGVAAARREPVALCNLQTDDSGVAKPAAKFTGVEGALAVPILDGQKLLGVLGVGKPHAYTYSDEEISLLKRLGDACGTWIKSRKGSADKDL